MAGTSSRDGGVHASETHTHALSHTHSLTVIHSLTHYIVTHSDGHSLTLSHTHTHSQGWTRTKTTYFQTKNPLFTIQTTPRVIPTPTNNLTIQQPINVQDGWNGKLSPHGTLRRGADTCLPAFGLAVELELSAAVAAPSQNRIADKVKLCACRSGWKKG